MRRNQKRSTVYKDVSLRLGAALLCVTLALVLSRMAAAADLLYARAIGDAYSYTPSDAAAARSNGAGTPPETDTELPGLGSEPPATDPEPAASGWSWGRVLLGVAIVGAMSALASRGGGNGEVQVSGTDVTGGAAPPPSGSSGGASAPTVGDTGSLPLPLPTNTDNTDKKGKKK